MSYKGPQRNCSRCRFWKHLPGEPPPADWNRPKAKVGLCEEPSAADRPRHLKLFGAGGLCACFTAPVTLSPEERFAERVYESGRSRAEREAFIRSQKS